MTHFMNHDSLQSWAIRQEMCHNSVCIPWRRRKKNTHTDDCTTVKRLFGLRNATKIHNALCTMCLYMVRFVCDMPTYGTFCMRYAYIWYVLYAMCLYMVRFVCDVCVSVCRYKTLQLYAMFVSIRRFVWDVCVCMTETLCMRVCMISFVCKVNVCVICVWYVLYAMCLWIIAL